MATLFEKLRTWLPEQMQQLAPTANTISYQRLAGGAAIDLTGIAWIGETDAARRDPQKIGPAVEWGDRDYLIPVSALPAEPARGDRITETINGTPTVYEVMQVPGQKVFEYVRGETIYLVHTKEQGTT